MKQLQIVLLISTLLGLAVFAGCSALKENIDANTAAIESCQTCHSGDTDTGNKILAAQAQYENSGHYNGPRTLDPYFDTTGHIYVFHGSNAMYNNGTPCSNCHTHQGFVEYVATGTVINVAAASQPGCFTCHEPHETGDFTLRTSAVVTLVDTSAFNYGKGNLCVTCHKAITEVNTFLTATWPKEVKSYEGPHHGPQSDLIMGKNYWAYGTNTYNGASVHVTDSRAPDSCVDCHMYEPTSRLSGTLQLGGHGLYLTGDVHGSEKDIVSPCKTCHTTAFSGTSPTFVDNGQTAPADWDGDSAIENKLLEIEGLRNTLISYLGNGTTYFSGDGTGPIENWETGFDQTTGEWEKDWVIANATLSEVQAKSFWNFKLFIEDKSGGIHNPTFAAQILYDAIDNLNDNAAAGLTLGGTRP